MATFTKEISFINPAFFNSEKKFEEKEVTVLATFKELSRIDRSQHELHFMIMGAFDSTKGKSVKFDTSTVLKMTDEFIETSMLTNTDDPTIKVTATEKTQFLNDSIGKLKFGMWLLNEKFSPFFSQLGSL
jgi:hypothetical protein